MFMDVEIPLWLIITFSVCVVAWPLILMAGGTAICAGKAERGLSPAREPDA